MSVATLARRDPALRELMDDPDCDPAALDRTYRRFRLVNGLVAGWRRIYRRRLRPLLGPDHTTTLLDIGCGGGDVARALAAWARRDGVRLDVTGIDPDARAHRFATARGGGDAIRFRRATSAELVAGGGRFDVVVSNHVLHHLSPDQLSALLADSRRLATRLVLHNDIERGRPAYLAYSVGSLAVAAGTFIRTDGLRSIRRSYRREELLAAAGDPWRVDRLFPARLLLWSEPGGAR